MILSICSEPRVLSVIRYIKIAITIIKISVPILLIVFCILDFVKAVSSGELNDALKSIVKRMVAAIIIFFIPTFVSIIADLTSFGHEYVSCFEQATKEGVKQAYVKRAEQLVLDAKNTLNIGLFASAQKEVNNLDDGSAKSSLQSQLATIKEEIEEARKEREKQEAERRNGGNGGISSDGTYTKAQIIAMTEQQVKDMTNDEFIKFIASAARLVYKEHGGVLPSITIAQAILESGWGNSFTSGTYNVYGLMGYPSEKPKIGALRQFDNFYEATYYHYAYFQHFSNVYSGFLASCAANDPLGASTVLYAYANGQRSYPDSIIQIITEYNLTQYDN